MSLARIATERRLMSWALAGTLWSLFTNPGLVVAQSDSSSGAPSSAPPPTAASAAASSLAPANVPPASELPPAAPRATGNASSPGAEPANAPVATGQTPSPPTDGVQPALPGATSPTTPSTTSAAKGPDAPRAESTARVPPNVAAISTPTPAPTSQRATSQTQGATNVSLNDHAATAVFVTIDRRLRELQRLPATAFALSGEDLARRGVTSVRELTAATPWLEVGTQEANIELYARGIGSNDNSEFGEPSVATFKDGVYIPRPRGFHTFFFDTERVEVALGPQAPMRGRGGLAGSINVISKPAKLGEWEANTSVQFGNYGQRLTRSALNVPFGDKFAVRIALFSERHDPFYVNRDGAPELRAAEDADNLAYRISSRWVPIDNVTVTLRLDDTKERGTGVVGSDYGEVLRLGVRETEVPNPRAVAFVGNQPRLALDHWGGSASIEVNTKRVGLELSSSYRELTYSQHTGGRGQVFLYGGRDPNLDQYTDSVWRTTSQATVNEIRLFAPDRARLRWNAGFFHFAERQRVFHGLIEAEPTTGWLGQEHNYQDVPTSVMAGYLDTTTDVTETFRTSAGFRLTSERRERHGVGGGFNLQCNALALAEAQQNNPDASCQPPSGLRWGTPGFAFAEGQRTNFTTPSGEDSVAGAESRVAAFRDGIASWGVRDDVEQFLEQPGADVGKGFAAEHTATTQFFPDFRVGLDVDVTPNSLAYATFTTGHKPVSLVTTASPTAAQLPGVLGAETLYAAELGSKNALLGKRLLVNGAAFLYALQENTLLDLDNNVAAVDARVLGLQLEAQGYLPRGFACNAAVMLLDARYLDAVVLDTRVAATGAEQSLAQLSGNRLPRAPRLTLSYGLSRTWTTEVGDFDWSVSGQTKSTVYMTPFNGEGLDAAGHAAPQLTDVVPWTTRLDAAIGYTRPEGDLRLDAFVTNATDMTYMTSLVSAPNTNLRYFNPPRQVGVRASLSL